MYPYIKRGADVILSLLALICLSPVYLIVALAVKLSSPGPVLFRQKRVGRGGAAFHHLQIPHHAHRTPRATTATHPFAGPFALHHARGGFPAPLESGTSCRSSLTF